MATAIFTALIGRAHVNTLESVEQGRLDLMGPMTEQAVRLADMLMAKLREIKAPPARDVDESVAPRRLATAVVPPKEGEACPEPS
jgi:hypothetical protein